MKPRIPSVAVAALCVGVLLAAEARAADDGKAEAIVTQTVRPVMERYGIPGMAVGVVRGDRPAVFNFGVASKATGKPVTDGTLFEVGSVSKTFTATLAAYAQVSGQLSLTDPASKWVPPLQGSRFDGITLLDLGTYTSGGLPLQVPEGIKDEGQLMRYFHEWKPAHAPGTSRTYSNPSIGLLGIAVARSLREDFTALMEGKLLPALGLTNTHYNVPADHMDDYAQGYKEADAPVRMEPGVISAETYGVRTTAGDLLRFVEANMGMLAPDEKWRRAIADTHTGYYRIGGMTQDLVWEQYPYPVTLKDLLAGNSDKIILEANPAAKIDPPLPPQENVLINKTGSTAGFSAYVAFVPARKLGVVLLANKGYPIPARVTAAHEILTRLAEYAPGD